MSPWQASMAWFDAALAGAAAPWAIALALALTTLLLEDLAIAAGLALAAQGTLSWGLSIGAVGGGIAAGDLGLYALGVAAARWPGLQRRWIHERAPWARAQLVQRLPAAVLLARVIPGLRLVTYTASGFLRIPLLRFCGWILIAVAAWTIGLYGLGLAFGHALSDRFGISLPFAVAVPILVLAAAAALWRGVRQPLCR